MNPAREDALWDAVFAAPHAPEPVAVLADALLDRGERYGEYLQLSNAPGAPRTRLKELRVAADAFLGPLRDVLSPRRTWRRGLLDGVATRAADLAAFEATRGHPAWGSVRDLKVTGRSDRRVAPSIHWLAESSDWRWLERVSLNAPAHYHALAEHPSFGVQHLQVGFFWSSDAPRLSRPDMFPGLTELQLDTVPMFTPAAETAMEPLFQRELEVLGFGLHPQTLRAWLDRAEHTRARRLRFVDAQWILEAETASWSWTARARKRSAVRREAQNLMRRVPKRLRGRLTFLE